MTVSTTRCHRLCHVPSEGTKSLTCNCSRNHKCGEIFASDALEYATSLRLPGLALQARGRCGHFKQSISFECYAVWIIMQYLCPIRALPAGKAVGSLTSLLTEQGMLQTMGPAVTGDKQ